MPLFHRILFYVCLFFARASPVARSPPYFVGGSVFKKFLLLILSLSLSTFLPPKRAVIRIQNERARERIASLKGGGGEEKRRW